MGDIRLWGRVRILGPDGTARVRVPVMGRARPDLATIDRVGRLVLLARRTGGDAVLEASAPLADLVALAGLPVEVERQPEGGEEPLWIEDGQEEVHRRDPPL